MSPRSNFYVQTTMKARNAFIPAALIAGAAVMAGCVDHEGPLDPPPMTAEQELFSRYVSLGNSITAGFQSGGIVDSTQAEAYPVFLAEAAGTDFGIPALRFPGCPAPLAQPAPLGTATIAPPGAPACALRSTPTAPFVQNLAVPGARILDIFDNLTAAQGGSATTLTSLILGGRTQIEAMHDADPTLVSVWIGNNDALAAAVSGIPALLTPLASFEADLDRLVTEITRTDSRDAILIGVVDAVDAVPLLQPGAYFWAIWQQRDALPPEIRGALKPVSDSCAPAFPDGTPNPLARNMVSFRILADDNFPGITCNPEELPPGSPHLLTVDEQAVVQGRIAEFNQAIASRAAAEGWIYIDPNQILLPLAMEGPPFNRLRKCQMLSTAETPEQFQQAIALSCPVPPAMGGAPNFFGSLISFDGVHPTAEAHREVARSMATALNERHGLNLQP